jgi:Peptidase family M28
MSENCSGLMILKICSSAFAYFFAAVLAPSAGAQQPVQTAQPTPAAGDPIQALVSRLEFERYKDTIKALTQFGDRRQGTDRNRAAVDWIEAQLKGYGCPTARIKYAYQAGGAEPVTPAAERQRRGGARQGAAEAQAVSSGKRPTGRSMFGQYVRPAGISDPMPQPNEKLRALNSQPSTAGPREEVYCMKVGTTAPAEMYIIGAHMDGIGSGEAANDDASGTALVMELARVLNSPDVQTERTIRFALWNNEEAGGAGARAYVEQRQALQGKEDPSGSGKYPEPRWLGMIQHDMLLFDHGRPRPDGGVSLEQRLEADVNIEFQRGSKTAVESQKLAWFFNAANEKYATDYPAAVGPHMAATDSMTFMDIVAAISLRENERITQIGGGWDPHWHQPTDLYATFSDKDFRLGLNAAQTTLAAVAQLAGATLRNE